MSDSSPRPPDGPTARAGLDRYAAQLYDELRRMAHRQLRDERSGHTLRVMARDAGGIASIWEAGPGRSPPRLLVRFDQPGRPVLRPYFAVRDERLYVIVQDQQSALWTMDVQRE